MNYSPLRINTIKPERQITFHLYVHFKEQYLLYFQPGDSIPKDKFKKLKKQKIAKFYIPATEEGKYQNFIDALLNEVVKSADTPIEEKVSIVEAATETAVEQIQSDPGSQAAYKLTQSAASGLRELVKENPEALKTMFEKKPLPHEELIKHSLNVCLLATKLAEILKFSEDQISTIMIAALMHDIGIPKCEEKAQDLFKKPKAQFTPDERVLHKEHIEITLKLLDEKPWINPQVVELIKHHEEVLTGAGPYKKTKLTAQEECLSLVNSYDKKILINKISPKQALKEIMVDEIGNYELKTINKFKMVLEQQGLAV
jgi:HD-GYP domain-containing protein (c-di-GMP phosphodiesterase class II)